MRRGGRLHAARGVVGRRSWALRLRPGDDDRRQRRFLVCRQPPRRVAPSTNRLHCRTTGARLAINSRGISPGHLLQSSDPIGGRRSTVGEPRRSIKSCRILSAEPMTSRSGGTNHSASHPDVNSGSHTNGGNYRPLWAHSLDPMDMIVSGWFMSLFQAWHPASMMAS